MSYSLPLSPVPAAGSGIPYTWFTDLQDAIEALRLGTTDFARARCQVYNNAVQSIGTASFTTLTFNTEDHDPTAMHSTSLDTGRLTVPAGMAGTFFIAGVTSWAANATGIRQLQIIKNGGATPIGTRGLVAAFSSGGVGPVVATQALVVLAAGDYVELQAYQDSGGNLNAGNASRELSSQFLATRVI